MGERLLVRIFKNDKRIANIYYHWSGYSISSIEETKRIIEYVKEKENSSEIIEALVLCVNSNRSEFFGRVNIGTLLPKDISYYNKIYKKKYRLPKNASRNNGLLAITEEGMNDLETWYETLVDVYLDTNEIDFSNIISVADDDIILEIGEKTWKYNLGIDLSKTKFDEINKVYDYMLNVEREDGIIEYNDELYYLMS